MSSRLLRPLTALAAAALAASVLAACGDSHTRVTTGTYAGESGKNAPYLNVGPLIYEVQVSRELNPASSEDAAYLQGLPANEAKLLPGEEWFAVFIQVFNDSSNPLQAAEGITISDTQGNVYSPLAPAPTNLYAYRGGTVRGKGQLPEPDTPAYSGPSQGALLLYKIKVVSLDNRPLEIRIKDPEDPARGASAELDV
jgi:hypothetical protein